MRSKYIIAILVIAFLLTGIAKVEASQSWHSIPYSASQEYGQGVQITTATVGSTWNTDIVRLHIESLLGANVTVTIFNGPLQIYTKTVNVPAGTNISNGVVLETAWNFGSHNLHGVITINSGVVRFNSIWMAQRSYVGQSARALVSNLARGWTGEFAWTGTGNWTGDIKIDLAMHNFTTNKSEGKLLIDLMRAGNAVRRWTIHYVDSSNQSVIKSDFLSEVSVQAGDLFRWIVDEGHILHSAISPTMQFLLPPHIFGPPPPPVGTRSTTNQGHMAVSFISPSPMGQVNNQFPVRILSTAKNSRSAYILRVINSQGAHTNRRVENVGIVVGTEQQFILQSPSNGAVKIQIIEDDNGYLTLLAEREVIHSGSISSDIINNPPPWLPPPNWQGPPPPPPSQQPPSGNAPSPPDGFSPPQRPAENSGVIAWLQFVGESIVYWLTYPFVSIMHLIDSVFFRLGEMLSGTRSFVALMNEFWGFLPQEITNLFLVAVPLMILLWAFKR